MATGRGHRTRVRRSRKKLQAHLEASPGKYFDVATDLVPMFPDLTDEAIVRLIKDLRNKYGLMSFLPTRDNGRHKIVGVTFRPSYRDEALIQAEHRFHTTMAVSAAKRVKEISFEGRSVLGYELGTEEIKKALL